MKETITIVMTHPDDFERMMGGTAVLLSKKYKIQIICVCRGQRGIPPGELNKKWVGGKREVSAETASVREKEARAAADIIGADITFLDLVDGDIYAGREVCETVAELFIKQNPVAVFAHSPLEKSDHGACSQIAWQGIQLSGLFWDIEYYMYFDQQFNCFNPDIYVNITDVIEIKRELMQCHKSQLTESDIEDQIDLNKSIGVAGWCDYAEGFLSGKALINQRWNNKKAMTGSILLDL